MAGKPTQYIDWCPDGDPAAIIQPASALAHAGFLPGQSPVAQNFNWLLHQLDQWIRWFDSATDLTAQQGTFTGLRPLSMRLLGGGNWTWAASTGVLSWSAGWNLIIPGIPMTANAVASGSVTLADGQSAFVAINQPYTTTGDTTSGSNVIANVANVVGLQVGMNVYGVSSTGIPAGAAITGISGNQVTLNLPATGSSTGAQIVCAFGGALTVFVATADENMVIPGSNKIVFARRLSNSAYVGVGGAMRLIDGQQRTLFTESSTLGVLAGENLTAGQVVYISPGAADGGRTAGSAYRTDAGATNGAKRSSPAGIVLAAATSGQTATVLTVGRVGVMSGLTTGAVYYLDPATLGGITTTPPSGSQQYLARVGVALSATALALGFSHSEQQAPLITRTYFTHFANAMVTTDTSAASVIPAVFAGNASSGSVSLSMAGAGQAIALVPLRLPGSGTIIAGSFDTAIEFGSIHTSVAIVRMDNLNQCTSIISGPLVSGPFVGPTTVGAASWRRYTMGTLSETISAGNSYFAYVQWNPTGTTSGTWVGFRFDVNTAEPYITAG